jgi:hypothetical protein
MALDVLVDVVDHFLESFLKLLKNLRSVHLFNVNTSGSNAVSGYYSSDVIK